MSDTEALAELLAERDRLRAELRTARGAIRELEDKAAALQSQCDVLRISNAQYERDADDPPSYLQERVIKAAGIGAEHLKADALRADVRELVECLTIIKQRTTHTSYRMGQDIHTMAEGMLAKHNPLQALADNGRELGLNYEDGSKT